MGSTDRASASPLSGRAPSILCNDVVKTFGGVRAVDGVSLQFEPGVVNVLMGPNGAGKTTLFHLIGGALQPDSGEIQLGHERINRLATWKISRKGVGRLFQDVRVFAGMTVLENCLVAPIGQAGESPLRALLQPSLVERQERATATAAVAALQRVGLVGVAEQAADTLSYGQQKLLAIARLLVAGATVLLLDEPAAGIDPVMVPFVQQLIRDFAAEGRTVVLIEHNMAVVSEIADRVYFLAAGRLLTWGSLATVLTDPSVIASYLGL